MGLLTRFFDRKRAANAVAAADVARGRILSRPTIAQTGGDQAATRGGREVELDAHRERREHPPTPDA